jgi:hypothetical protein
LGSLLLQLQKYALDPTIRASDLLRNALVVAKKLHLTEFESWMEREIDGYPTDGEFPLYRWLTGRVMALNPVQGTWLPIIFKDGDSAAARRSRRPVMQSIAELESLVAGGRGDTVFMMDYSHEHQLHVMKTTGFASPPMFHVSISELVRVLDAVRNGILRWALKLEADGVLGDEATFSDKEIAAASGHSYVTNFFGPQHFHGPVGAVQNASAANAQVRLSAGTTASDLDTLFRTLREAVAGVPEAPRMEVIELVDAIEDENRKPSPSPTKIRAYFDAAKSTLLKVGEDVAARVLAELVVKLIGAGGTGAPKV